MKKIFSKDKIDYDGSQLRSGWIKKRFGLEGDAITAFAGECDVKPEFMVDMEDLEAGASIYSKEMLHFIAEHFDASLIEITLKQRLLICIIKEMLESLIDNLRLTRSGDDLFDNDCKITVSIATTSSVSGLIHTGINIQSDGTPVKTKGLKDFQINPNIFAESILNSYVNEIESVLKATQKVKKVG